VSHTKAPPVRALIAFAIKLSAPIANRHQSLAQIFIVDGLGHNSIRVRGEILEEKLENNVEMTTIRLERQIPWRMPLVPLLICTTAIDYNDADST
jgi:hypothetical protein